ncbi:hypothetical protein M3629_03920 [Paenibacillus polysaccharolyticus]|jgi:biopolymer transport protein ExbB/TolQ|uniref:hypothetical protein n=1 Tax=Paenibacillus polysaccharolyticus TaxID=582692 RepID=UPI00203ECB26|nr:hypothetical protein [Paenibacillus polysaccharolyticus]MCM3131916.1 hypothetical protein [Paenibacillus polysaccharolyticus]
MDVVAVWTLFAGFLKTGAWMPLAVLAISVLIWIMIRDQKEQIKESREESNKREQKLNELIDANKAEAKEREERLMTHLDKTERVQARMVATLERIQTRMEYIERAVNIDPKVIVKVEKEGK